MNIAQKTKLLKEKVEKVYSNIDIPEFPNVDSILKNLTDEKVQEISDLHLEIKSLHWEDKVRDEEMGSYMKDTQSIVNGWYFAKAVKAQCESRKVITPEEFLKRWNELPASFIAEMDYRELYFRPQESELRKCNEQTKKFLSIAGLPAAGAYLEFQEGIVSHILDIWGSPEDWSEEDRKALENYSWFGDNGSGDTICIDHNNNDIIVMLDHEYGFVPIFFINSSIAQFAECLLVYETFLSEVVKEDGEEEVEATLIDLDKIQGLEKELTLIDCRAVMPECFWRVTLDDLYETRRI